MRAVILGGILVCVNLAAMAEIPPTVGIEGRREISLPVDGLKARPPRREATVTVRIASVEKHGDATVYDLRYIGLVPGRHDLRSDLLHADGTVAEDLPPIEVEILGLLPADQGGMLISIPRTGVAAVGGYRWIMMGLGLLWLAAAIPIFKRRRVKMVEPTVLPAAGLTLPERLRMLVAEAAAGRLNVAEKAELERKVVGHWCQELGLESAPRSEAIARLKEHGQAGPLLRAMEEWLHRRPGTTAADLGPLLAAYGPAKQEAPAS